MSKKRMKLILVVIFVAAVSMTMASCDLDDPDPTAEEITIIVELTDKETGEDIKEARVSVVDDYGVEQVKDQYTEGVGYVFDNISLVEDETYSVKIEHDDYHNIETDFVAEDNKIISIELESDVEIDTYKVVFIEPENGVINAEVDGYDIESGDRVEKGSDVDFEAKPDEGYRVSEWLVNGEVIEGEEDSIYTYENLDQNIDIEVSFVSIDKVSNEDELREALKAGISHITLSKNIEEAEPFLVDYDLVLQAEEGKSIKLFPKVEVSEEGSLDLHNKLTLENIELMGPDSLVSASDFNGALNIGKEASATHVTVSRSARITGASRIETLTANAPGISLDGEPEGIEGPYEDDVVIEHEMRLTELTGSGSVVVENEEVDFTLESETESELVEEGIEVTVTAEPYPGWEFDYWSKDAEGQNNASFTTTLDSVYEIGVAFSEELEPAEAKLSNLDIAGQSTAATIVEGDSEDISVRITNAGEEPEEFKVTLEVGDEIEKEETTGELSQNEYEDITFEDVTGVLDAGDYNVNAATRDDIITGSLTVQEPANFVVNINKEESDAVVATGGELNVNVNIENTGDVGDTQNIVMDFGDEEAVIQEELTLDSNQSSALKLSYEVPEDFGVDNDEEMVDVTVSSDDDEDSYQVEVKDVDPAFFEITDMNVESENVFLEEEVVVTAKVKNIGGLAETQDIVLTVYSEDEEEIDSAIIKQDLHLEGGEIENIDYSYEAPEEEGNYILQISSADDKDSADLTAEKEAYDLTFEVVVDENGEPIEDASVEVNNVDSKDTDSVGKAVFEDIEPDTYYYEVTHEGYEDVSGSVEIVDGDVTENVEMRATDNFVITALAVPEEVIPGEQLSSEDLTAEITNKGAARGTQTILLEIDKDGDNYDTFEEERTLEPGDYTAVDDELDDDGEFLPDAEGYWGSEYELSLITEDDSDSIEFNTVAGHKLYRDRDNVDNIEGHVEVTVIEENYDYVHEVVVNFSNNTVMLAEGHEVKIEAVPAADYEFESWGGDAEDDAGGAQEFTTTINNEYYIEVNFELK